MILTLKLRTSKSAPCSILLQISLDYWSDHSDFRTLAHSLDTCDCEGMIKWGPSIKKNVIKYDWPVGEFESNNKLERSHPKFMPPSKISKSLSNGASIHFPTAPPAPQMKLQWISFESDNLSSLFLGFFLTKKDLKPISLSLSSSNLPFIFTPVSILEILQWQPI